MLEGKLLVIWNGVVNRSSYSVFGQHLADGFTVGMTRDAQMGNKAAVTMMSIRAVDDFERPLIATGCLPELGY